MGGSDPNRPLGIGFRRRGPSSRVFYTAVVKDFYSNPSDLANYHKYSLSGTGEGPGVGNPQYVDRMPRNSISAYVVSDKRGKFKKPFIFYPFFSPHLCLPVKPGEQVWVIFETLRGNETLGYWITRKCVDLQVDDLNYTHADRMGSTIMSDQTEGKSTIDDLPLGSLFDDAGSTDENFIGPGFPDGSPGSSTGRTLRDGLREYREIISLSEALGNVGSCNQFIGEPVPRFSKAVGDVVLQGSNNAMIVLGSERTGPINTGIPDTETINPFPGNLPPSGQGAIDIVVGRGQTEETAAFSAPDGVLNTRGYYEIPKNPIESESGEENAYEGNPDFVNDFSRIYVSMKSNGDSNFSLVYPGTEGDDEGEVAQVAESPYTIIKSSEVRLVSRGNGSIRIVKEGAADEDKAVIMMLEDGTIMVDGPKIVIGSGIEGSNGQGEQVIIGRGATEPIVLGNELKEILDGFMQEVIDFIGSYDGHTHGCAVGPTSPPVILGQPQSAKIEIKKTSLINILSKVGKTK